MLNRGLNEIAPSKKNCQILNICSHTNSPCANFMCDRLILHLNRTWINFFQWETDGLMPIWCVSRSQLEGIAINREVMAVLEPAFICIEGCHATTSYQPAAKSYHASLIRFVIFDAHKSMVPTLKETNEILLVLTILGIYKISKKNSILNALKGK